jgi:hypothetical protein
MNAKDRKRLERIAYHEAGHAAAAWASGLPIRYVTIAPDQETETLGHMMPGKNPAGFHPDRNMSANARDRIERQLICTFAGPEAEARFAGRRSRIHASGDHHQAVDLASRVYFDGEQLRLYLRLQQLSARALIGQTWVWQAVEALACALLQRTRINAGEARKIMIDATAPDPHVQKGT